MRRGVSGPAPELVIVAGDPAGYLKHDLPRLFARLLDARVRNVYLRVVDIRSRRAFEYAANSDANPNHTVTYVQPDLQSYSPIHVGGFSYSPPPPCPR